MCCGAVSKICVTFFGGFNQRYHFKNAQMLQGKRVYLESEDIVPTYERRIMWLRYNNVKMVFEKQMNLKRRKNVAKSSLKRNERRRFRRAVLRRD